ncbi:MAG: hypothetical protein AAF222_00345 [Pseudomonadota bacterium]
MVKTNVLESVGQESSQLLRDSLNEAQMTVRAYDTKAQIVGVGYIFALGIVAQINEFVSTSLGNPVVFVLLSWGVILFPIFHFGHVLYPTRKTAPKLSQNHDMNIERILYLDPESLPSVEKLRASVVKCDLTSEYCYELIKTSTLREIKRKRFLRGLIWAAFAFAILFLSHIGTVIGLPSSV